MIEYLNYMIGWWVKVGSLVFLLMMSISTWTQTLESFIQKAHEHSLGSKVAETTLHNSTWQYKAYQADLRPNITLDATLPNLVRSIEPVIQDDGSEDFVNRFVMSNEIGLRLSQVIKSTGGTLYVQSSLERLDVFGDRKNHNYYANPIRLGFFQPISPYNPYKWLDRIEPQKYSYAKAEYSLSVERISLEVARTYFDLLINQQTIANAQSRSEDAKLLLEMGEKRFERGFITESELLQLQISLLEAESTVAEAEAKVQNLNQSMQTLIGDSTDMSYQLAVPDVPFVAIQSMEAVEIWKRNNPIFLQNELALLNADEDLAEAKAYAREINLYGSIGLSNSDPSFVKSYQNLIDQEVFNLGVQIPLADWGKSKSRIEIAKANKELAFQKAMQITQNAQSELVAEVNRYNLLQNQVVIENRLNDIAERNFAISQELYINASLSINDFLQAQNTMTSRQNKYINTLAECWISYYTIRSICLFDFLNHTNLLKDSYE